MKLKEIFNQGVVNGNLAFTSNQERSSCLVKLKCYLLDQPLIAFLVMITRNNRISDGSFGKLKRLSIQPDWIAEVMGIPVHGSSKGEVDPGNL